MCQKSSKLSKESEKYWEGNAWREMLSNMAQKRILTRSKRPETEDNIGKWKPTFSDSAEELEKINKADREFGKKKSEFCQSEHNDSKLLHLIKHVDRHKKIRSTQVWGWKNNAQYYMYFLNYAIISKIWLPQFFRKFFNKKLERALLSWNNSEKWRQCWIFLSMIAPSLIPPYGNILKILIDKWYLHSITNLSRCLESQQDKN